FLQTKPTCHCNQILKLITFFYRSQGGWSLSQHTLGERQEYTLDSPISLTCMSLENMQTPHREAPADGDSNPGPPCCEAAVLPTAPSVPPKFKSNCFQVISMWRRVYFLPGRLQMYFRRGL
ncbi:hypothetical protein COCON_G00047720, partial [Conger conger]